LPNFIERSFVTLRAVTRLGVFVDEIRGVFAEMPEHYDTFSLHIAGSAPATALGST
jgi:hypothetical protein